MRKRFLLPVLLSASIALPAQQNSATTPKVIILPTPAVGCPVKFGASIDTRAIVRSIGDRGGDRGKDPNAPLLDLTFGPGKTAKIVGASVTVHGLSPQSLYLPVGQRPSEDRTQTFEFNSQPQAALAGTEVLVTKMSFVRWAELTQLRYADGSTWQPSAYARCKAVPSGFRLVSFLAQ
jgi:hypothetical protein